MSGKNKLVGFAVLSIVLVLAAGLVVSGCGGGAAPKPAKVYKVTFEASGGEPVPEAQLVEAGSKIELPKTMARTKFTFSGWYKDLDCKEPWDFARDTVEGDIILFANWKPTAGKSGGGGGGSGSGGNSGGPSGGGPVTPATLNLTGTISITPAPSVVLVPLNADYSEIVPGLSYQWYKEGVIIPGATSQSYTPPDEGVGKDYSYTVTVSAAGYNSKTSDPVMVYHPGEGTPENPWKVFNVDKLLLVGSDGSGGVMGDGKWSLNKNYMQVADLDMTGKTFTPIGSFNGSYNGNGYTIKNLNFTDPQAGMFSRLTGGSLINIRLENCTIVGTGAFTGGIVSSMMGGTIENCSVSGNISANSTSGFISAGGVAGYLENVFTIKNCYSEGSVQANNPGGTAAYAGGVVGRINVAFMSGTLQNCYSIATVKGTTHAGGMVGIIEGAPSLINILDCVALNKSITAGSNIGRLVGEDAKVMGTTILDNKGWDDIPGTWTDDATGIDGANVSLGDSLATVFSGWDTLTNADGSAVWTIPTGGILDEGDALPTLNKAPQSPAPTLPTPGP